jgi:methionyl-tRNA synthetase
VDAPLEELCRKAYGEAAGTMPLDCPRALAEIWKLVRAANKYIDATEPWKLNKNGGTGRLSAVIYNLAQCLYTVGVLLLPFIPDTAAKILNSLGVKTLPKDFKGIDGKFGALKAGTKIEKSAPLYPRLDIEKEIAKLSAETDKQTPPCSAGVSAKKGANEGEKKMEETNDFITIDDFAKIKLRTAKVVKCEKVEKADKLLNLTLELGAETRTVLSGIAEYYRPEDMVGKTVVVVANLAPRKMRGIDSHGMILCADADGKVVFVTPESGTPSGAEVR